MLFECNLNQKNYRILGKSYILYLIFLVRIIILSIFSTVISVRDKTHNHNLLTTTYFFVLPTEKCCLLCLTQEKKKRVSAYSKIGQTNSFKALLGFWHLGYNRAIFLFLKVFHYFTNRLPLVFLFFHVNPIKT